MSKLAEYHEKLMQLQSIAGMLETWHIMDRDTEWEITYESILNEIMEVKRAIKSVLAGTTDKL